MSQQCSRRCSGVRAVAEWRHRGHGTDFFYTALAEHEAVRVHLLHVRTKMAAASLSERRGGSFFPVRF